MFTFKFERLFSIKDNLLNKNILEFYEINKKILMVKSNIKEIQNDNKKRLSKLNEALSESKLDSNYLTFMSENIYKDMKNIDLLNNKLNKLDRERKEKLSKIKELQKEKKQLEKLKEKQYKKYVEDKNRQETRFLDEITTTEYAKKSNY